MANGEILTSLKNDIGQALLKKLPEDKRLMFKTMQTFVIYLEADHAKVNDMFPKVNNLWEHKELVEEERKEAKKMILSPVINTLITWAVSTLITVLTLASLR